MKNMLALSITIVLVYTISSQLGIAFSRASIALGETEYLCDAFAADCIRLSDSAESRALYYSPDDSAESTAPYYSPDDSAKSPAPGISPSATYLESSEEYPTKLRYFDVTLYGAVADGKIHSSYI
ncbi:hypothetical protein MtrunA17_Chr2g0295431 [Medicago truncatula]|uniref:Transmembrane protein n=1 Tax=Medicago truncatula TaxID=3880 RepID=A0A396JA48_MEDTR|nr:hypothetical protein MtrunA17_Chr2g0295431 [Medicago truncatula]